MFYFLECSYNNIKRIEKQKVTTQRKRKSDKKRKNTKQNEIQIFAANKRYRYNRYIRYKITNTYLHN